MDCPNCGCSGLRPKGYNGQVRHYRCWKCGFEFETVELIREVAQRQTFQATLWKLAGGNGTRGEGKPTPRSEEFKGF